MEIDQKVKDLMDKLKKLEKGEPLDLSSDEDLSIAIMNLISIEEHLFFSAEKTGKVKFYQLLQEVREMRKELLKMIIKDYEGEAWCLSKHLLAASMRLMEVGTKALTRGEEKQAYDFFLMEVGTKALTRGEEKQAYDFFKKAYDLYNLFWGINLKVVKPEEINQNEIKKNKETPINYVKNDFLSNLSRIIGKMFDCCRE